MKKLVRLLAIAAIVIVGILIAIPMFFKDDIVRIISTQSGRYLRAGLEIGDMDLSMFRSFPDLNVSLEKVCLTGTGNFEGDTLVEIPRFEASINLASLVSGNEVVVNRIWLKDFRLNAAVDTAGRANYDILVSAGDKDAPKEAVQEAGDKEAKGSEKGLALNDIVIEDASITFKDYRNSTYAGVRDIDLELQGNLSGKETVLRLVLGLDDLSYRQNNSTWINGMDLKWETDIAADFGHSRFTIKKNRLSLNNLELNLDGSIAAQGDGAWLTDLRLNAPDTEFKSLLALVPDAFGEYTEGLDTKGGFKLDIKAGGIYAENRLPAFSARFSIDNAYVRYPDLPESIHDINLDLDISNPGGPADSTVLALNRMSFNIGGKPFDMQLLVTNPKDPFIKGKARGSIDFTGLKKAFPMQDMQLEGSLTTDITLNGHYRYIEREEYEKFVAQGNVSLQGLKFSTAGIPEISIPEGKLVLTPERLKLDALQAGVYSSDFLLEGFVSNYLPYLFRNETLKGRFSLRSNSINLNEFIVAQMKAARAETAADTAATPADAGPAAKGTGEEVQDKAATVKGALEIPRNVDVQFTTDIAHILFDRLDIRKVQGDIRLAGAVARLKNLSMEMLNGQMVCNGEYNTADPRVPAVDLDLKIDGLDIHEAYNAFSFIRKSLPVAVNCQGEVSAAMRFASVLDKEMSPVMTTADGKGFLESKGIVINNNKSLDQLAGVLKNDELKRLSISHLKIEFDMQDGNITVAPFKTKFAGNPITISGSQTVEGNMDYTLSMNVRREFFGKEVNDMLKNIPGSDNIKTLDLDVKVGGTLDKPVIRPDLSKAIKAVTQEASKALKGNLLEGLKGLFK